MAYYLYEITLNEEEFHEKYNDFDYFMTNPHIENVYETCIPLEYRFLQEFGNCLKPVKKALPAQISYSTYLFATD